MERICRPGNGLFPAPKEIDFTCSCPDWASMCKHVAAVLYGVGARLDERPELLFQLRRVDANDLLAQAGAGVTRQTKSPAKAKVLDDSALADVFGIEMAEPAPVRDAVRPAAGRGRKLAGTATAASKVLTETSTKSASASRADAGVGKTAGARPSRATVAAKTPLKTRRPGAARKSRPKTVAATRKTRGAPAGVAAKQKPNRRSRA